MARTTPPKMIGTRAELDALPAGSQCVDCDGLLLEKNPDGDWVALNCDVSSPWGSDEITGEYNPGGESRFFPMRLVRRGPQPYDATIVSDEPESRTVQVTFRDRRRSTLRNVLGLTQQFHPDGGGVYHVDVDSLSPTQWTITYTARR